MSSRLDHIAEISRNARSTWFGLLAVLLYGLVALGGVRDSDFFVAGAGAQLPLVNIQVPTVAFFIAAPLLTLALHAYFHLYLLKLWRALAPDGEDAAVIRDDTVYPWLIADAALYQRPDVPRRTLGWMVQLVSLAFGWAATPVVLALFWVRSWAPHDQWLSLFLAGLLVLSATISVASLAIGRSMLRRGVEAGWFAAIGAGPMLLIALVAAIVGLHSWERTEGLGLTCRPYIKAPFCTPETEGAPLFLLGAGLYPAQLRQAPIVAQPSGWLPRPAARKAFFSDYAGLSRAEVDAALAAEVPPVWVEAAEADFRTRRDAAIAAMAKRDFSLGRPLFGAFASSGRTDLRHADLRNAFLVGLALNGARLSGAKLDGAHMEGVVLWTADLSSGSCDGQGPRGAGPWAVYVPEDCTSLRRADLSHAFAFAADFPGAMMDGATLTGGNFGAGDYTGASMRNVSADRVNFEWGDFDGATLTYASLRGADFDSASLRGVRLGGSDMTGARFVGADLSEAEIGGDVSGANFSSAVLRGARTYAEGEGPIFWNADLRGMRFVSAALEAGDFRGALLTDATFRDTRLAGADFSFAFMPGVSFEGLAPGSSITLAGAVGDAETRLPPEHPPLRVGSCYVPEEPLETQPMGRWLSFYRFYAERLGMETEAYIAAWVCSQDNPLRYFYGPTANPHAG